MPTFRPKHLGKFDGRRNNMECLQGRTLDPAVALVNALGDQQWVDVVKYAQLLHYAVTQMESREEWEYWLKQMKYSPKLTPVQGSASAPVNPGVAFRDGDKVAIKWTSEGAMVGNKTTRQNVTALVAAALDLPMSKGVIVTSDRIALIAAIATKFPVDGEIEQHQV